MEPVQLTIDGVQGATDEASRPLVLRMPHEGDLPRIAEMFTDPAVIANTMVPVPWPQADRDAYVERYRESWRQGWPRWMIADAETDDILGMVGLRAEGFGAEIIYQTAPWARRRQVALRACHTALRFTFDELDVPRVAWGAVTGNHLSRLIALRLGFTMEGISRHGIVQRGTPTDIWAAAMLPGELRDPADPPADYPLMRRRAGVFTGEQPRLTTEHSAITLRALTEADIEPLTETGQDPVILEWTTLPRPYRLTHSEGFVRNIAPKSWREGDGAVYAIADDDDKYCGTIEIRLHTADPYEGDIGCMTAPWARGRGYMTAATRSLIRYGFDALGLERIVWHAHAGNAASIRVAEKAGFVAEGVLRNGVRHFGEHRDLWQGSVLRTDLENP